MFKRLVSPPHTHTLKHTHTHTHTVVRGFVVRVRVLVRDGSRTDQGSCCEGSRTGQGPRCEGSRTGQGSCCERSCTGHGQVVHCSGSIWRGVVYWSGVTYSIYICRYVNCQYKTVFQVYTHTHTHTHRGGGDFLFFLNGYNRFDILSHVSGFYLFVSFSQMSTDINKSHNTTSSGWGRESLSIILPQRVYRDNIGRGGVREGHDTVWVWSRDEEPCLLVDRLERGNQKNLKFIFSFSTNWTRKTSKDPKNRFFRCSSRLTFGISFLYFTSPKKIAWCRRQTGERQS